MKIGTFTRGDHENAYINHAYISKAHTNLTGWKQPYNLEFGCVYRKCKVNDILCNLSFGLFYASGVI